MEGEKKKKKKGKGEEYSRAVVFCFYSFFGCECRKVNEWME